VKVELRQILESLTNKKIPFVLTGQYGNSNWTGRPRATHDIDLLVKAGRNFERVINALKALYPELVVRRFTGLTGFFVPGENQSVIDVSCPQRPDNEETLRTAIWLEDAGLRYRIPKLEAALANKYGAMLSLGRDPGKRLVDAGDFTFMVKHASEPGRDSIDMQELARIGEKVWPGGGGQEITRLVQVVQSGKVLALDTLHGIPGE